MLIIKMFCFLVFDFMLLITFLYNLLYEKYCEKFHIILHPYF